MTGGIWTATGAGLGALLRQPVPCPQDAPGRALAIAPSADQVAHARAILAAHRRAGGGIAIRPAVNTYRGYDDFMAARWIAAQAAGESLGSSWHLIPGASVWARVPAAWVRWQGTAVSGKSPRDMILPAARYWPGGTLPVGPDRPRRPRRCWIWCRANGTRSNGRRRRTDRDMQPKRHGGNRMEFFRPAQGIEP